MEPDVLIVGAGVAGLSAARALQRFGVSVLVVDRARGVGGRCATQRVDGQPVDQGVAFLHGRDERFLAAVAELAPGAVLAGWPTRVLGRGLPCQPDAFHSAERRFACRGGASAFPKHLASAVDVRLNAPVIRLQIASSGLGVRLATGEELRARTLVLAMPVPQAAPLLRPLAASAQHLADLLPVLETVRYAACLTLIARFPRRTPAPPWQAAYPEQASALHSVFHDSDKRSGEPELTLVLQGRSGFSRAALAEPQESWGKQLLADAASIPDFPLVPPVRVEYHVWRYARVLPSTELATPLVVDFLGGTRLGICGDAYHPGGGLEAAYTSGIALAARLTYQGDHACR